MPTFWGLWTPPQEAVVEQYPPNFALPLKFWDRNLCSIFIPYELSPCVVDMLQLNSVLVTVCLLRLLFCYFLLFTNNSRNTSRLGQHHFIHYNLFITVCSHIILFPLKQLFILYPAGAINENNKVHLCWLMQKPQQLSNSHSRKERSVCLMSRKSNGISLQVSGFGRSVLGKSRSDQHRLPRKSSCTVKLLFLLQYNHSPKWLRPYFKMFKNLFCPIKQLLQE